MSRNVTLHLDDDVIRKAKVVAAKRGVSLSGLLRAEIARLVDQDIAYERARESAIARLHRGNHLGGGRLPARDELHDRGSLR